MRARFPGYAALRGATTPVDLAPVLAWFGIDPTTDGGRLIVEGLRTALVHDSYLHEHHDELPAATPAVLNALDGLGGAWLRRELAVRLLLHESFEQVGQLSARLAAAPRAFAQWTASIQWLTSVCCYGKGEVAAGGAVRLAPRLLQQAMGLLAAYGDDMSLRRALQPFIDIALEPPAVPLDPRTALSRLLPNSQQCWTVTPSGPDHARTFRAELAAPGRAPVSGTSTSKKLAQAEAARAYLSAYAPSALPTPKVLRPSFPRELQLPRRSEEAVRSLTRGFGVDPRFTPLVAQALIHPSWLHEHRGEAARAGQRDNRLLALVGSSVLQYEHIWAVVDAVLCDPPQTLSLLSITDVQTADALRAVGLSDAAVLGLGQGSSGLSVEMAANVFQAVVAALYIAAGSPGLVRDIIPEAWVPALGIVAPRTVREQDPTTVAEKRLAATGLEWRYEFTTSGPDNAKSFAATVVITSSKLGRQVRVGAPPARNKPASRHLVASRVVAALDWPETEPSAASHRDEVLAGLLLVFVAAVACDDPGRAGAWRRAWLLGAHLASEPTRLAEWAKHADDAVRLVAGDGSLLDPVALASFYRAARAADSDQDRDLMTELGAVLTGVADADAESVLDVDLGERLVGLCAAFRASGIQEDDEPLGEVIHGWSILHRGIEVNGSAPAITVTSGERTVLDHIVRAMTARGGPVVVTADAQAAVLRIRADFNDDTDGRALVRLFASVSPRMRISLERGAIQVAYAALATGGPASPFTEAVRLAAKPISKPVNSVVADALHDIKNQLVAVRHATLSAGGDRTARLEARLAASRHLDEAASLARRLQAGTALLSSIPEGETEVAAYLRRYVASLMVRLPNAVMVVPPRTTGEAVVALDPVTVAAVLDNLVSNATEAMPDGGTLELDWLADENTVVLVVKDSGPGMPEESAAAFRDGRQVHSTKPGGNGLGLLGVQALLRRVGGRLELMTSGPGTTWWVTLPAVPQEVLGRENP